MRVSNICTQSKPDKILGLNWIKTVRLLKDFLEMFCKKKSAEDKLTSKINQHTKGKRMTCFCNATTDRITPKICNV